MVKIGAVGMFKMYLFVGKGCVCIKIIFADIAFGMYQLVVINNIFRMIEIDLNGTGMFFVEVKTNAVIVLGYGYLGRLFSNGTHISPVMCLCFVDGKVMINTIDHTIEMDIAF